MLTGRTIDAEEALRLGLVIRVVPAGALDTAVTELAQQVAAHPRGGLAAAKSAIAEIRAGRPGGETRSFAALRTDTASQARIARFLERKRTRRP
jgi:enoyl-CoA hydratase